MDTTILLIVIQMLARLRSAPAFTTQRNTRYFTTMRQQSTTSTTEDNTTTNTEQSTTTSDDNTTTEENDRYIPPWNLPHLKDQSSKAYSRFRQHVNPLSRRYQMATDLPNWPQSDFNNVNLPLYLDIGCGKGGFLLELVGRRHGNKNNDKNETFDGVRDDSYMNNTKTFEDTTNDWLPDPMNYLGLEIRPGVSQYSQARVEKRGLGGTLSFVGCNANVDLDRLLSLYQGSATEDELEKKNNRLAFVSIQFPDPHFKKAHSKRRVVTPELVSTLAKYQEEGDVIFLQSDIKDALEAMREKFVEDDGKVYFDEWLDGNTSGDGQEEIEEYQMSNPLGIPTEREVSVLKKGLPIYRTLFKRNGVAFEA